MSSLRIERGVCCREPRPIGILGDDGGDDVGDVVAVERARACQHLVEHAAERPDVRALVDGAPARLFGRHVRRGAEDEALLRPAS